MATASTPPATIRRRLATLAVAAAAAATLGGTQLACSSTDAASNVAGAATAISDNTVLVDVRTPEEFAGGHLEGALNIDVQSPDFAARVGELDPDANYLVYCRSGNRSGQAIDQMRSLGFTDLANLGSVAEASSATGVPVVR
jgi:phage shock protein E